MKFLFLFMFSFIGCSEKLAGESANSRTEFKRTPANGYFSESYQEARNKFFNSVQAMRSTHDQLITRADQVKSLVDQKLFVDSVYLPSSLERRGLVVIASGVHGGESYAGSAIIHMFLQDIYPKYTSSNLSFLIIHSLNPFGMKYFRRTNENNVDLNRNFQLTSAGFKQENKGYGALSNVLNKKQAASTSVSWVKKIILAIKLLLNGRQSSKQAVLQGQFVEAKGIFYGGNKHQEQKEIIDSLLNRYARDYQQVYFIDLHTGYGSKNKLHFLTKPGESTPIESLVFKDISLDRGDKKDFYKTTGGLPAYVEHFLKPKPVVSITFEFGTLGSNTLAGSIDSLYRIIQENQGYQYGFASVEDKNKIRNSFQEAFYPSDLKWQSSVLRQAKGGFETTLNRFNSIFVVD